MNLLVKENK